uniref:copper homeostasis protein CutC n=1 Tax=Microbacterium sp. CPCC 204701 TaxID=2493084 RepID=UPI000FDAB2FD
RPREGGFVYSADEAALITADIRACVARGAGGVVVGALDEAGGLDRDAVRRWRDAADSATLVFHRAIDAAADPSAVFDAVVAEGVDRVLTSGGAARSIDGVDRIAAFAARSGNVEVMAGGGVRIADIPALFAAGVDAVHLSARVRSGLDARSGPGGGSDGHDVTDPALVCDAVAAAL